MCACVHVRMSACVHACMCVCVRVWSTHISWRHHIVAEVAAQLVSWNVGEQRGCDGGGRAGRGGGRGGGRGARRGGVSIRRHVLIGQCFLQAVSHHHEGVEPERCVDDQLEDGGRKKQGQ